MRKNTGRTIMCAFSALAVSALAGMTGMAQEESDVIAIPYEQSDAWQEVAMVNDDTVSTGINIRAAASEDSEVIGYLYNGGAAWVINKGDTWTEIYSGGLTGFVKNEYLMYADEVKGLADYYGREGVTTTWDNVQLFAGADGSSQVLEYLETGDSFILAEDGGHWLGVQYGADDLAYVSSEDVTRVLLLDTAVSKDESYTDSGETYAEPAYTEETYTEETYTEDTSYTDTEGTADTTYQETEPSYTEDYTDTTVQTEYTEATEAPVYTEETSADTSYTEDTSSDGTEDVIEDDGSYYDADSDTYYDENGNVVSETYSADTYVDASDYADAEAAAQAAAESYAQTETYVETEAYVAQTEAYTAQTEAPQTEAPQTEAPQTEAPQTEAVSSSASTDDVSLLAALIYCEAGNQSYEGMVAVGAVVMNRVNSPSFPNTISEVIYQSGQFTPASSGALASALASGVPSACYEAASAAIAGENPVGGALYFNTGSGQGMKIGDHQFY